MVWCGLSSAPSISRALSHNSARVQTRPSSITATARGSRSSRVRNRSSIRNTILPMTDFKHKLKTMLIERLKFEDMTPEDIDDDAPLFAGGLGLDSIDALEIVVMLESEFGIKVKNESAARDYFVSISTLAAYVEEKVNEPVSS